MADPTADPNADLAPIYDAMRKADAAGDADSVRKLATYLHTRTAAPAAAPAAEEAPAAPEEPGLGRQFVNKGLDIAGTVARGVGTATGAVQNIGHMMHGEPTEDPRETGAAWAAPFANSGHPDIDAAIKATNPLQPVTDIVSKGIHAAVQSKPVQSALQSALNTPAGQTLSEAGGAAGDVLNAAGTLYGGVKAVTSGLADEAVTSATRPGAQTRATMTANEPLTRARADGFTLLPEDVQAKTNGPAPGQGASSPHDQFAAQKQNIARATNTMAQDAGLRETTNANPTDINSRIEEAGDVYAQVGDAIGHGRTPTPNLDHELSVSAANGPAVTPTAAQNTQAAVQQMRDHFAQNGFDGPEAVSTVRDLRRDGQAGMSSLDPNAQTLGRTQINMANAIENEMMQQLPSHEMQLRTQFPESRMQLAKLHELKAVTEGGQDNPAKVLQLKIAGAPLSGAADAVANATSAAPLSMRGPVSGAPGARIATPQTRTGLWSDTRAVASAVKRNLPGGNILSPAYQETRYGAVGGEAATPPASAVPTPDRLTRGSIELTPPPGEASPGRPAQGELPIPKRGPKDEAAPPFELAPPEGLAFEPHQPDLRNPPERTNTPQPLNRAEWDRAVLDTINRYKGELPGREGPPVALGPNLGTPGKTPKPPTPTMALRKKLGEAMQ